MKYTTHHPFSLRFWRLYLGLLLILLVPSYGQTGPSRTKSLDLKGNESNAGQSCDAQFFAALPQPHYVGLWREGAGAEHRQVFASWDGLVTYHAQQPLSLIDIETFVEGGARFYAGLWRAGAGGEELSNDSGQIAFQETRTTKNGQGKELVEIELFEYLGSVRYLAVWRSGAPAINWVQVTSAGALESQAQALNPSHFLIDVETWKDEGGRQFLGVFRPRVPSEGQQIVKASQSWCPFHDDYHELEGSHRLQDLELFVDSQGERRYMAFWTQGSGDDYLFIGGYELDTGGTLEEVEAKVAQKNSALRLFDFEILDDPSMGLTMQTQAAPSRRDSRIARTGRTGRTLKASEEEAPPVSIDRGPTDIKTEGEDDDGVIIGAPPLHDTGSSGPD